MMVVCWLFVSEIKLFFLMFWVFLLSEAKELAVLVFVEIVIDPPFVVDGVSWTSSGSIVCGVKANDAPKKSLF